MRVAAVPPLLEAEFALKKLKRLGCTAHRNRMPDLRLDDELDLEAERSQLLGNRFRGNGRDCPIVFPVHQEHRRTICFLGTGFIGWRPENAITTPIIAQL